MRIGQLAKSAGITISRIRFYEAKGMLTSSSDRLNRYREYAERDLGVIAFIERTQRLGFSLSDIAAFLPSATGERPRPEALAARLEAKLREIDDQIVEARQRRADVERLLEALLPDGAEIA